MLNAAFWLSLVLAAAGCTGLLLAGRGNAWGWAVGLAVQPVWVIFALKTGAYGLVITAAMYAFVYGRNLISARRAQRIAACTHERTHAAYGDEAMFTTTLRKPFRAFCYDCPMTWPTIEAWKARTRCV